MFQRIAMKRLSRNAVELPFAVSVLNQQPWWGAPSKPGSGVGLL